MASELPDISAFLDEVSIIIFSRSNRARNFNSLFGFVQDIHTKKT